MADQTLDISWQGILKVFIAGFIFYILFLARDIAVWFFFALVISLLFEPAITFLKKLKVPKIIAVIMVYLSILGFLGLFIYLIAPIFVIEIQQFSQNIPLYFEHLNPIFNDFGITVAQNFEDFTTTLINSLQASSASIIKAVTVFFGGISSTAFIFILAFFISLEENGLERFLALLVPKKYEEYVMNLFERAQYKVSGWFGARIIACIFVGMASLVIFLLFKTKYAFTLALISGALNFVPYVGPLVTSLLTLLFVGVSDSWTSAVIVIGALLVIQEIENKIITPLLMKKFLDLPPILVLMSLLVGGTLFGFLGIIFIVPVFGIIYEATREFLIKRKEEQVTY